MTTAVSLLPVERIRLVELEGVVERGQQTFVEVGEALLEIREQRLYREDFGTFEDYCQARWAWTGTHGRRLIDAAEVARQIAPTGAIPANEWQARELAPLKDNPTALREVWGGVIERAERNEEPVTGPVIRKAVRDYVRSQADLAETEMQAATAWMNDEQRQAYGAEMSRQRGELTRLVTDLAALQDPAVLIETQGGYLLPRTIERAESAHAWLTDFLSLWRARNGN